MNPTRRALLAAAALPWSAARAQAFPARSITVLVPSTAGGVVDISARHVQPGMAADLGQPVVVENRPGGGGHIAAAAVARAAPDGYTLLCSAGSILISGIVRNLPYAPMTDLAPVARVTLGGFLLLVPKDSPFATLADLIAYGRANPGRLNFSSSGNGTIVHMTGEMFRAMAGVDIVHVPYKGAPPALTDLIGGHVHMMFTLLPSVLQHVKTGALRPIAIAAERRDPSLPDVPTFAEAGMPGFVSDSWYGILAPAGTPRAIVARLNAEVQRALAHPDVKRRLAAEGAEPRGNSPEQFEAEIRKDLQNWIKVAQDAKVSLE